MTQQIYSSPKAFPAGHIGNMSKGKDAGIGEICTSKPTWFGSRSAIWKRDKIHIRYCYRELAVSACMTAWALLGNYAYNGKSDGYDHFFNWFFVVRDPFYAIPEAVAPFVMPFLNLALFFAVEMIIHLIFWGFGGRRTTKRT